MNSFLPVRNLCAFSLTLLGILTLSAQPTQSPASYVPKPLAPSLRMQAESAMARKDYTTARSLLERWVEADPRDGTAWYNLACTYALTSESAKALDAFERSVDAGFRDGAHAQADPDLSSVRSDPRFAAALAAMTERQRQSQLAGVRGRFAPMRTQGSFLVLLPPDYGTNGGDYPVCVLLHGSGGNESSFGRTAEELGREGVIYVAIRAPFADIGTAVGLRQPAFTAWPPEITATNSPILELARRDYVDWVFDAVNVVQKDYRARKGKVFIYGYSQGGGIATTAAALYPEKVQSYFAQAGSRAPDSILTAERLERMKQEGVQVWLVHGRDDTVVPVERIRAYAERLTAASVPVEFRLVAGDHPISDESIALGKEWISKVVRASR